MLPVVIFSLLSSENSIGFHDKTLDVNEKSKIFFI